MFKGAKFNEKSEFQKLYILFNKNNWLMWRFGSWKGLKAFQWAKLLKSKIKDVEVSLN